MALFLHDLKIFPFAYKSAPPFDKREGLLLSWKNENNERLISDICLLPGFNQETLSDVLKQLRDLKDHKLDLSNLYPSVDFALNHPISAQDCLMNQSFQALILKKNKMNDSFYSLFKTLKIKTSDFSTDELLNICQTFAKTHKLKFDAQRKLLDQNFIDYLINNPEVYQYIEEPAKTQDGYQNLKIALDETIYLHEPLPEHKYIQAIIYKPTLCGGFSKVSQYFDKHPLILSSCYESSIGIQRIIKLHQLLYPNTSIDIGLDTIPVEDPFGLVHKAQPYIISSCTKGIFETIDEQCNETFCIL